MRKLEDKPWWPQLLKKKDDYSLRELAEMFGATPGAINTALKRNGITRKAAPPGPRTSRRKREAKAKAAEVVKRGPRKSTVAKLEPFKDQLGDVADMEIASLAGVSNQTVAAYRRSLGIAPTKRRGPKPAAGKPTRAAKKASPKAKASKAAKKAPKAAPKKRGRKSKIEPFDSLLGKVADAEIAAKAGVSDNAVRNRRFRMGIAAPPRVTKAKAAPKAAPKAAKKAAKKAAPSSAPRLAFRVYQKGDDAIVVAGSLVEAARIATEKGRKVKGLELLGPVLS
ncbi:MAG TPA: hypothetical protein QGF58_05480 [Myxococcota bacterium]|nr:hypothetical protein [Myxococcota bacterium]